MPHAQLQMATMTASSVERNIFFGQNLPSRGLMVSTKRNKEPMTMIGS